MDDRDMIMFTVEVPIGDPEVQMIAAFFGIVQAARQSIDVDDQAIRRGIAYLHRWAEEEIGDTDE